MSKRLKLLWGVCGIGHGHIFRQLPLIEHFSEASDIVIFGYGESHDFFTQHFQGRPNIRVERVAVPFYVGNKDGLDFESTAKRPENRQDYTAINGAAMAGADKMLGRPDLVVSDYEPVCAQYAYAHRVPLVTIDQQSKYLCGVFPAPLNGQNFADEIMRLRLFFPTADNRMACSFFRVSRKPDVPEQVEICPPVLSDKITGLRRNPDKAKTSILVYLSSQRPFGQSFGELNQIFQNFSDTEFHVFGKNIPPFAGRNVQVYEHGDARFHGILSRCNGIISTAGHTLLSEAMYLGIPVYAVPLPLYEQEMNAHIINHHGFGVSFPAVDGEKLKAFIGAIPDFESAIQADRSILLRKPGQDLIIKRLKELAGRPYSKLTESC